MMTLGKIVTNSILTYFFFFNNVVPSHCKKSWSIQEIVDTCNDHSNRVCDPGGILSKEDEAKVRGELQFLENSCTVNCESNDGGDVIPNVQAAIVIVHKVLDGTAESYATTLHNRWGVGNIACGKSTGILLFVSTLDRSMYISTSDGVQPILTNARLESIMDGMKRFFTSEEYAEGLLQFTSGVNDYFKRGPPSFEENYPGYALIGGILLLVLAFGNEENPARREYAMVHSQLSKLDRERALALMGRYKCTSCPICLEDFQLDANPVSENDKGTETINGTEKYIGNDGKPVQVLKCGHAFCDTCWNDWISKGSSGFDVRKCPICKQDINASPEPQPTRHSSETQSLVRRNTTVTSEDIAVQRRNHYAAERRFRLTRLMARYPRHITLTQLERWSSSSYDGDLVRDEEFMRTNPARSESDTTDGWRSSSDGGSSEFGGGSSSGGCGSSW